MTVRVVTGLVADAVVVEVQGEGGQLFVQLLPQSAAANSSNPLKLPGSSVDCRPMADA